MLTDILVSISAFITGLIVQFGYLGIFVAMVLESAALPVPSEIIMPFAGFVVFQGRLDFLLVLIAGTLGNLAGSIILYYIGLKGGRPILLRYGKYIMVSEKEMKIADNWFKRFGSKVIFFSRMLPVVRTFISLPAGTARMDFKKFCFYTLAGSIPWNLALVYLGFVLGERWSELESVFQMVDILAVIGLVVIIVYIVHFLLKKKSRRLRSR
jgi:membrane protein DedA with SNARE-associated domain